MTARNSRHRTHSEQCGIDPEAQCRQWTVALVRRSGKQVAPEIQGPCLCGADTAGDDWIGDDCLAGKWVFVERIRLS